MKTENKTNRVTGILKKIFLFIMVFLIAGIFTEVHPVKADYEQYVKLKKCYSSLISGISLRLLTAYQQAESRETA